MTIIIETVKGDEMLKYRGLKAKEWERMSDADGIIRKRFCPEYKIIDMGCAVAIEYNGVQIALVSK